VIAILVGSAFFHFLSAFLSVRFVYHRRLGRPWLLVSIALLIMGTLTSWEAAVSGGGLFEMPDAGLPLVAFLISFLFASGFALTEQWFLLKERLEGRFRLIADADRALVGVIDEEAILSSVCGVLAHGGGYRLALVAAAEPDGSVRVAACAGEGLGFLTGSVPRWDDRPEGQGPTETTLRTGEVCAINSALGDARFARWRSVARKYGILSAAAVPFEPLLRPRMALTVFSGFPSAFGPVEIEALRSLAHRMGSALQSARRHRFFVSAKGAYDDLLRAQRDGVILVREERIVRANPAAAALLGHPGPEDLSGRSLAEALSPPERDPRLLRILAPVEGDGEREPFETSVRRGDGSLLACEITATWLPRAEATEGWEPCLRGPLGMIILRDVTQRKRAHDALRRERDFSARVLEASGVLVAHMRPDGAILLVNRHWEEVTGHVAPGVIGRPVEEFLASGPPRDAWGLALEGVRSGRPSIGLECPIVTGSGEERLVVWNLAALGNGGKTAASIIATGADVTERRMLEAQVIEMQKMEAVGTLAGGIAHDFNNLLTGILGNLDLALSSLSPDSQTIQPVSESIKASERAARLIRQLLEFSRRTPLERRPVDVGKVAQEVALLLSQTIDRRIAVAIAAAGDLWQAEADSNQIHQVVMNLCLNARDAVTERLDGEGARPAEGYRIRIRVGNAAVEEGYCRIYPYARPGEFVLLEVEDNGVGMDDATQARVFEPFFTTKKPGKGTGLGLSTVYGIMKQHAGWITLDSRPGAGTAFRAYFPRSERARDDGLRSRTDPAQGPGRETVLFVDDEEMIRDLGRQILEPRGYMVLTAVDGREALNLFVAERRKIDLVILDHTMPSLSGVETLSRMHAIDPGVKVILSSGHPRGAEQFSSVAGVHAFLEKPYRAEALARIVRQVLDGR
jgi:PAS domain S-box-containing protein